MIGSNYAIPAYPATVAANNGLGGIGGGDSGILILLFVLLFGGGLGGRGAVQSEVTGFQMGELSGKVATQNSVNQGFSGLSAQNANETAQLQNSMNQGFSGLNTVVQNGFQQTFIGLSDKVFALSQQLASCCCELGRQIADGIGQVRYDMSTMFANTNERILMSENRISAQLAAYESARKDDRIRALELKDALCGVPKVANQFTYPAPNPYAINNCNPCG